MGCVSSKIQNEDAVGHCGHRKSFVKQAVSARTGLASAHAKYVQALSSTAIAFRQFAEGEFRDGSSPSSASSVASSVEESPASSSEIKDGVSVESAAVPPPPPPPPAMRLRSTPTEPITVILSPPREDFYRPPPPPESWEYPDIFRPPTPLRRYRNIPEEEDEEDIPSLEVSGVQNRGVIIEEIESEQEEEPKNPKAPSDTQSDKKWRSENRLSEVQSEAQSLPEVQSGKDRLSEAGKNEQQDRESKELDGEEDDEDDSSASEEASSRVVDGGEEDAPGRKEVPLQPMALVDVLRQVEEQFVRAADAGKPVLRMLEARKVHNQIDRGYSDHSSRLLSALSRGTWSPRSLNSPRGDLDHEVSGGGLSGSHAATLDRLYAWEKKLYEEVKAWEGMSMELDRKRKILRNLDAKGAKPDVIDKTRASMKALETEITVAVHAMEASSSAIQRITDDEMLPQLMELLQLLAEMWREMQDCHKNQLEAAMQLRVSSGLSPVESTSVSSKNTTIQLESCLNSWHTSLSLFFNAQKDFVRCLKGWIEHSLPPDPSSKKNGSKYSKRNRDKMPKIQHMCEKWGEALERIPVLEVTNKIKEYSQTLREIGARQAEEIRIQKRAEHLGKELNKKITSLNNIEKKKNHVIDEEKRSSVDALARKVQEEQQKFNRAIQETRAFTLISIQRSLPPLFQAVESFATSCMNTHQVLYDEVNSYTMPVA